MFSAKTAEYATSRCGLPGQFAASLQRSTRFIGDAIPEGYLAKNDAVAERARLIRSKRGLHGRSVLAVPSAASGVYEVMQAVYPMTRIPECPWGSKGTGGIFVPAAPTPG